MALVKYGGGIIQMSGSVAGNTFARNRYGNYVRAKTKPVNPNTARQAEMRSVIAILTTRWAQTLDNAKRTAWNDYADGVNMKNRLAEVVHLSGFNHYIRSNAIRVAIGYASIDDGPVINELPAQDETFAIAANEATQQISISFNVAAEWAVEAGGLLFAFLGKPQNAQRNFFAGPWRRVGAIVGESPGPIVSPVDKNATYVVSALQRVWAYARIQMADGRLSEPFRADTFCTADGA